MGTIRDTPRYILLSAFKAALPIVIGYVALGIPCGILCAAAGLDIWMVILMSVFFYSGSGQYMIPNLFLAGSSPLAICASVALVSSRQTLYGSALVPFLQGVPRRLAVLCASNVTDESFGVNIERFHLGNWRPSEAFLVNCFSQLSWIASNVIGVLLAGVLSIGTAIASFAMTSLFLCLMLIQKRTRDNVVAGIGAVLGVIACKLVGLSGPAILIGALIGIACGMVAGRRHGKEASDDGMV